MKKNRISALALAAVMSFGYAALPPEIAPTAVVEAASVLAAPEYISYTSTSDSIALKWDKVTGADAYRVFMYNSKTKKFEKYKDVKSAACTVTGLDNGKKYNFKIAALKKSSSGYDAGKLSETFSASVMMCIPDFTKDISSDMRRYGFEEKIGENSISYTVKYDGKYSKRDFDRYEQNALDGVGIFDRAIMDNGYTYEKISTKEDKRENGSTADTKYKIYYNDVYVGNYTSHIYTHIRSGKTVYTQATISQTFTWKDGVQFGNRKRNQASSSKQNRFSVYQDSINIAIGEEECIYITSENKNLKYNLSDNSLVSIEGPWISGEFYTLRVKGLKEGETDFVIYDINNSSNRKTVKITVTEKHATYYYASEHLPQKTKKSDQIYRSMYNGKYFYILIPAKYDKDKLDKAESDYKATH